MHIFILSVQFEGEDALEAFGNVTRSLRASFKELQKNDYKTDLKKIKIYLAVGGSLGDFPEPNGCNSVSFYNQTCVVDLVMHRDIWQHGQNDIVTFLKDQVTAAFEKLVASTSRDEMSINGSKLLSDVSDLLQKWSLQYLS